MTGTPINALTNLYKPASSGAGSTLTIHALFNGSIQGMQAVENQQKLAFPLASGTLFTTSGGNSFYTNGASSANYVDNTATLAFSDSSGDASPYIANGNYAEENIAIQPFVFARSVGSGAAATSVANISNVLAEQIFYGIPNGRLPLSSWTTKLSDTNTWIYLMQRTADSGTRRCETAEVGYQFSDPCVTYIYDYTNNFWFDPVANNSSYSPTLFGSSNNGIVGIAGYKGANTNWGYGYVGGGDIKNSLNSAGSANAAIACLSFSDAQGIGSANWNNVISYNGAWPTAAGIGLHGNTGTNDFSPITSGFYPLYGKEVVVHLIDPTQLTVNDQGISKDQIGSQTKPGSFLGVLDAQVGITPGVTSYSAPLVGSIENEIEASKTASGGATAIRLIDFNQHRAVVGGEISPF
jgi:hypothetical protein